MVYYNHSKGIHKVLVKSDRVGKTKSDRVALGRLKPIM